MTKEVEFDAVIAGRQACIGFERVIEGHRECGVYGRGSSSWFIDKDDAEEIRVEFYVDGTTNVEAPLALAALDPDARQEVLSAVDGYLRENAPEDEDEDDGPDYPDEED